ncbi:MAG TPA: tetratricopeptide repeat protein [Candidatus Kryptonia bacterium]|nr:tetratricopeptide repeat protein [Candidatus Kryptonia bacterium]
MTRRRTWMWGVGGVLICTLTVPSVAWASARSQALYARGLVPFHNGRWDDAYRLFDQAVKADAKDAVALYYRGLTAARRGQPNLAIPDLEQAAQLRPQLPHLALDLGVAYFDAGQYATAIPWLERARETAADRFPAAFFLGLTHYRLNDFAKAGPYLAEAEKDPELRTVAHYYAGLVLLRQGRESEGRTELSQASQGRPDSETTRAAQGYLSGAAAVQRPPAPPGTPYAKRWSVYGDVKFEYDSNVAIAPDNSGLRQSLGIAGAGDGRAVIGFGGAYKFLDSDVGHLTGSYDFYQSMHFQLHQFDLQGHRVQLEGARDVGPVQLGLGGTYDFYALNYQSFFQDVLVTPWVALPEGEATTTQAYYTFRGRDFFRNPFDPARDSHDNAGGIRQYGLLGSADRVFSVGYQFDADDPISQSGDDFQYKGNQFDFDVQMPIANLARGEFSYLFRLEDYQFPNSRTSFTKRRHDNEHQIIVACARDLTDYLELNLAFLADLNNSNIPDFEYNREIISIGIRAHY